MTTNTDYYAEILLTTECPCCGKKLGMKLYEKMKPSQTQRCYGPNNIKSTLVKEENEKTII